MLCFFKNIEQRYNGDIVRVTLLLCNKEVHFGCICGSIPLPDLNMVGDELPLGVF